MIRLAVPDNVVFEKLYKIPEDIIGKHEIYIIKTDENQCFDLLISNRADAALLNPLTYGKGLMLADFRIIDAPMLCAENFSGLASIVFNHGMQTLSDCISSRPDDFIMQAGKIVLSEKYDISLELKKGRGTNEEMLNSASSFIAWNTGGNFKNSIDITEEWFDTFEIPLPLAFWVCRSEEYPVQLESILNSTTVISKNDIAAVIPEDPEEAEFREGRLIYGLNRESEEAIEQTLQILYYHQYFKDIPALKILGRE